MLPICVVLQLVQVHLDALQDHLKVFVITGLKDFLYDVVAKLILHRCLHNKWVKSE